MGFAVLWPIINVSKSQGQKVFILKHRTRNSYRLRGRIGLYHRLVGIWLCIVGLQRW